MYFSLRVSRFMYGSKKIFHFYDSTLCHNLIRSSCVRSSDCSTYTCHDFDGFQSCFCSYFVVLRTSVMSALQNSRR
jgi:hypothetical protein